MNQKINILCVLLAIIVSLLGGYVFLFVAIYLNFIIAVLLRYIYDELKKNNGRNN